MYPAPAFVFTIQSPDNIKHVSETIYRMISFFLKENIAHNIYIAREGINVLIKLKLLIEVTYSKEKTPIFEKIFHFVKKNVRSGFFHLCFGQPFQFSSF